MTTQLAIGSLDKTNNSKIPFRGKMAVYGFFEGRIHLRPHAMSGRNDDAPDYGVYLVESGEREFHIGNAWLKNSEKVDGGDFLSMTLDSPSFPHALTLAAFPPSAERNETLWRLTWSRPRQPKSTNGALPPRRDGETGQVLDDEIPF